MATAMGSDQRDAVAGFWLAAPMDQLEALWNGGFGALTVQMVQQMTAETSFTSEQVAFRNELNKRIGDLGLNQPLAHQLLLAVFLHSPPGLLKVANAETQLPAWLAAAYKQMYETSQPVMTFGGEARVDPSPSPSKISTLPNPDFNRFRRVLAMVGNHVHQSSARSLKFVLHRSGRQRDLHGITGAASISGWFDRIFSEQDFERIWDTDFGDRYWALVRSGVQKEA